MRVPVDARGRIDVDALEQLLMLSDVGTVVATLGTTSCGAVDPLADIVALRDRFDFRLHVDAAYGGYFSLAENLADETKAAYDAIRHADSIAIDPHKHGLQPYGCGCVLFRDSAVGRYYKHDSPYTYFTSDELHLGEISLECSRAGASAVALWSTMRLLPAVRRGAFAGMLEDCRAAAVELYARARHRRLGRGRANRLRIIPRRAIVLRRGSTSGHSSRAGKVSAIDVRERLAGRALGRAGTDLS